jgi:flagellar biosynthesis protein FliQ
MFSSLFFSLVVFALIVSMLMAALKHDHLRPGLRHAGKLFAMMVGAVIAGSWLMRFL